MKRSIEVDEGVGEAHKMVAVEDQHKEALVAVEDRHNEAVVAVEDQHNESNNIVDMRPRVSFQSSGGALVWSVADILTLRANR